MEQHQRDQQNTERQNISLDKHHSSQQGDVIYVLRTAQQHHVMLGMDRGPESQYRVGGFFYIYHGHTDHAKKSRPV